MDIIDNISHSSTKITNQTNAISFGGIRILSDPHGDQGEPQIEASGNNVYTVWGGNGNIFFRKSSDAGNNFQNVMQLSNVEGAEDHLIAKEGNNVYVVWTAS